MLMICRRTHLCMNLLVVCGYSVHSVAGSEAVRQVRFRVIMRRYNVRGTYSYEASRWPFYRDFSPMRIEFWQMRSQSAYTRE